MAVGLVEQKCSPETVGDYLVGFPTHFRPKTAAPALEKPNSLTRPRGFEPPTLRSVV